MSDIEEMLETALRQIASWSRAYPLKVFPEPDLARAHELLAEGGVSLSAVSAHAMRHAIEGVGKIAADTLQAVEVERLNAPFKVGDRVEKFTGDYCLGGVVRAVFPTGAGRMRYAVEHPPGFLHIYAAANLRHLPAGEPAALPTG